MTTILFLLWKDSCGCRVYRHAYGFSLAPCKAHKAVTP